MTDRFFVPNTAGLGRFPSPVWRNVRPLGHTVGLSPFYFQRLFKRLVNKPVQEYVKLRAAWQR